MTRPLPDQSARNQALEVNRSFIVQAPAGSGKTELLTLRYLKLLTQCKQPEEVLAITFTRKAASEMRDRIITALLWCQRCMRGESHPQGTIEELRYRIGQDVLERDSDLKWQLLENPTRFRVQTIDSFCFYLAKQLPVLSQTGSDPKLQENIDHCFRAAINATLEQLESKNPIADDIERLLIHLDNDIRRIHKLLTGLLKSRDQWYGHLNYLKLSGSRGIEELARHLAEWINETLAEIRQKLNDETPDLVSLYNFAAANLAREGILPSEQHESLTALPGIEAQDLHRWQLMVDFLLTMKPAWRNAVQKKHGFPASNTGNTEFKALNKEMKQLRKELIERLADKPDMLECLAYLRLLPPPDIKSSEWEFLAALFRVLHHLNGQLILAMRRLKVMDYTQVSASAMLALGDEEEPTDITLALDHVIRHILVDEFQDTSHFQRGLLEKLTVGWEPGDGRSLFLVGDPMQSCYGFRNANVSIYLDVMENSLNNVALDSLRLSTNFRSQAAIVSWVNEVFDSAFPQQVDISRGAVPYSMANAVHDPIKNHGVSLNILDHEADAYAAAAEIESEIVANRVAELRKQYPDDSIAVLVRVRDILTTLVPRLREAGLSWTASDIDRLDSLAIIDDLMCILRIILHPGDRLAWIALLRAPWCGLGISDLHALATHKSVSTDLWKTIQNYENVEGLSDWACSVLGDFVTALKFILDMRFRTSLRDIVETGWRLLCGSACITSRLENDSVQCFLDLIEQNEVAGGIADMGEFELAIEQAFVPSPVELEASGLHLLTMHKAKGLEFDHVLIPALNRIGRSDDRPLYISHERVNQHGDNRLFLAGLTEAGEDDSPLYNLLRHEHELKNQLESTRLLYIAITRARKSASLYATLARENCENIDADPDDVKSRLKDPAKRSLLAKIWPFLDAEKIQVTAIEENKGYRRLIKGMQDEKQQATHIRRFNSVWQLKESEKIVQQARSLSGRRPGLRWPDSSLLAIRGTLIHRCLEQYVLAADQQAWLDGLSHLRSWWALQLRHLNPDVDEVETEINAIELCCNSIEQEVRNTLQDASINWVFNPQLEDSQCELTLSRIGRKLGEQVIENRVIDRTFMAGNHRWIIDYKTSSPWPDEDESAFITRMTEEFYSQLTVYKRLFKAMEPEVPIKTALLFTALPRLVEVPLN